MISGARDVAVGWGIRNLVDRKEKGKRNGRVWRVEKFKQSCCVENPMNPSLQAPSTFGMLAQCLHVGVERER